MKRERKEKARGKLKKNSHYYFIIGKPNIYIYTQTQTHTEITHSCGLTLAFKAFFLGSGQISVDSHDGA